MIFLQSACCSIASQKWNDNVAIMLSPYGKNYKITLSRWNSQSTAE